jgi:hypothetical protein
MPGSTGRAIRSLDRPRRSGDHGSRLPRLERSAALALLLAAASSSVARAADRCPTGAGGGAALAQIDPELRLHFIDERLALTAHRAQVWTWGWGIGIGVATIGNLIPLAFVAPEDRIDWYVGAATTVVGIVPLLIAPLDVVGDARALRARLTARGPSDDVCALLADAETRLVRDAKNQADGQRWWLHVGNVALNTGVGLFLALGYHHWAAGALNAIVGSAIGEAIILTQPTSSIGDLQAYRAGSFGPSPKEVALGYAAAF